MARTDRFACVRGLFCLLFVFFCEIHSGKNSADIPVVCSKLLTSANFLRRRNGTHAAPHVKHRTSFPSRSSGPLVMLTGQHRTLAVAGCSALRQSSMDFLTCGGSSALGIDRKYCHPRNIPVTRSVAPVHRQLKVGRRSPRNGSARTQSWTTPMIEPAIRCRRCKSRMDLVATIQPMGNEPGLNAYACTTCGHTDSELIALHKPARLAL